MPKITDSRERLIRAALDLFHQKGYGAVGTNEICAKAGVNKGTFYHFFPSKTDLAIAACDAYSAEVHSHLNRILRSRSAPRRKLERLFEELMKARMGRISQQKSVVGCLVGNLTLEVGATDPRLRKHLQRLLERFAGSMEEVIKELQDAGEVAADIDPREASYRVVAYLQGCVLLAKATNDMQLAKKLSKSVLALLQGTPCPSRL